MPAAKHATHFTIGKLSQATGVKVETIRYYEHIGLLPEPPRSASGYRQYTRRHQDLLSFVRRGRELGFALDDIRNLLALQQGGMACGKVQTLTRQHLQALDARIRDLTRLREQLSLLEQQCAGGNARSCPVVAALLARP